MDQNNAEAPIWCSSNHAVRAFGLSRSAIYRSVIMGDVRALIERGTAPRYLIADLAAYAAKRAESLPRKRASS